MRIDLSRVDYALRDARRALAQEDALVALAALTGAVDELARAVKLDSERLHRADLHR